MNKIPPRPLDPFGDSSANHKPLIGFNLFVYGGAENKDPSMTGIVKVGVLWVAQYNQTDKILGRPY